MNAPKCPGPVADAIFGPRVDVACRSFDFTIFFEDLFFSCIPSAIILAVAPLCAVRLWKQPANKRRGRPWLHPSKLISLALLGILQASFLGLRVNEAPRSTLKLGLSLAADILALLATASSIILSHLYQSRSRRPSTVLAIYFSAFLLLSIPRLRTWWAVSSLSQYGLALPVTLTLIYVTAVLVLALESTAWECEPLSAKPSAPETTSGFLNRLTFTWLAGTFRKGFGTVLSVDSLPGLDPQMESHRLHQKLKASWAKANKARKNTLLLCTLRAFMWPLLSGVLPRLFQTGFTFAQPFLVETTIEYVGLADPDSDYGKALVGAFALVFTGLAASTGFYFYQTFRLVVSVRGGLISLIHAQTLSTRKVDLGDTTAVTLMGTDTERIVNGLRDLHELWGCLVDIAIAVYLLQRQLGVACLVPVIIVIVFIAITGRVSAMSNDAQRSWIEKIEARLRLTSSMLGDMKAVKTLGLSTKMYSILHGMRLQEINGSQRFRVLLLWQLILSNSPAVLAPVATFALYTGISLATHNESLLAARAFTSLTLISLLSKPVLTFIQAIPAVYQCFGCFDRIQEYCTAPQAIDNDELPRTTPSSAMPEESGTELEDIATRSSTVISIPTLSFGWTKDHSSPVLKDISLNIEAGSLVMVAGPIGSGKSTLLETILGETYALSPGLGVRSMKFCELQMAYCSQIPWLRDTTIRQNIVGCSELDEKWYNTVVQACGLSNDLENLPHGDSTVVGSNGASLSGGQKQRVVLARAVYSRKKVVILDDIFSGIDAGTTSHICTRLFGAGGLLRRDGITVVLATHNLKLFSYADRSLWLENGRLTEDQVAIHEHVAVPSLAPQEPGTGSMAAAAQGADEEKAVDPMAFVPQVAVSVDLETASSDEYVMNSDKRRGGDLSIYKYYSHACGYRFTALFLSGLAVGAFFQNFPTIWLDWWSQANARHPGVKTDGLYLGVYATMTLVALMTLTLGSWSLIIKMVSNSARHLHSCLLETVLGAPLQFFQTTDTGTLTNRFSQDMELIDMALPLYAINYVFNLADLLVKAVILLVFAKFLGAALPLVVAIVYVTQTVYMRTSRQVRLLDIEAKAPLYNHFIETVAGSASIRAMGWRQAFQQEVYSRIDYSQRPFYLLLCIQQGLALVLDLTVALLAVLIVLIIVSWRESFDGGNVGVALSMLITFSATLMSVVKFWTMMEMSLGAVSRVRDFVNDTEAEEPTKRTGDLPPSATVSLVPGWPSAGAIKFEDVSAGYSLDTPPVLSRVSISIEARQKVALCGPSGSGKSSFILSLLRLIDIRGGAIKVDDLDIVSSGIQLTELRSRLNVITQDPFLMPGTVRFNMDPFGTSSDEDIERALRKLSLWGLVQDDGCLDKDMAADALSAGQRQLFCLARAMVRKGNVLILDEATSNVDDDTERIMYDIIDSEFSKVTVLSVVHRLSRIGFYDRVCVLDKGKVVEFGSPEELIKMGNTFSDLVNKHQRGR